MPLRWDPFNEVLDLTGGVMAEGALGINEPNPGAFRPPVDVFETDEAMFIKVEVSGVAPEEIKVEIQGNQLVIFGERGRAEQARRYHHLERLSGRFERRFSLAEGLLAEGIEASYHDGVLEVRLPKSEGRKARQIEIQASHG